jgi:mannose-1-phosphate guanylyltransferase
VSPVVPFFRAIVPAGGAGTRLWPASRRSEPKFLLDLFGTGRSLVQSTWDRLMPLVGTDGVTVVTGAAQAPGIQEQLPPSAEILIEPSPRDSMPAIGLAAAILAYRHPNAVVGSFAADHVITDPAAFVQSVREAIEAARLGYVVTIGIPPTRPSTGFGYIEVGEPLEGTSAMQVTAFTEKPDAATAAAYLASGTYRWNAGMFVARAATLLDRLADFHPEMAATLRTIAEAWDTPRRDGVLGELWPTLPKIAIDHAIAEPLAAAGGMAVVPGAFGWDDVGDWASVADLAPPADAAAADLRPPHPTTEAGSQVVLVDAEDVLVAGEGQRMVAVVGIPGAVIVDTPDALLVTTRAHAQEVRHAVAELERRGRTDIV